MERSNSTFQDDSPKLLHPFLAKQWMLQRVRRSAFGCIRRALEQTV
ncbi:MAG: hypothetical protein ACOYUZ_06050 [Patescibacteria group bacterium]